MRYYEIPVFLHNLKNYDSHLIIERANELSEREDRCNSRPGQWEIHLLRIKEPKFQRQIFVLVVFIG